ncbi:S1 RNA-binding domain-containing protein [Candidatus Micrarchaeota archaeon]|nr:S1 RNA-binding domain-containing protein [Candidatus Micrarchaeota archaeon]
MVELPDEDELVLAVIKKILPYGAFCTLTEYGSLEAFLHVSEVAPRWIKNIHEFLSEGQRYVVKVHHVDREKNQVDVSIKRVSEEEKKRKLELVQTEKRGEKLFEIAVKDSSLTPGDAKSAREKLENEFGDIYSAFKEVSLKEDALAKIDLPKLLKEKILEIAQKNIKKPVVNIDSIAHLTCYSAEGVEVIKKALKISGAAVHYLGAPRYKISITAPDYKSGEKKMLGVLEHIKDFAAKNNCDFRSERL